MKQKMVCILLAGMLAVSMSGCGSQEEAAGDSTGQTRQEEVSDSAGKRRIRKKPFRQTALSWWLILPMEKTLICRRV